MEIHQDAVRGVATKIRQVGDDAHAYLDRVAGDLESGSQGNEGFGAITVLKQLLERLTGDTRGLADESRSVGGKVSTAADNHDTTDTGQSGVFKNLDPSQAAGDQTGDDTGDAVPAPDGPTEPVGDLTKAQMSNADTIIEVGERMGISRKGQAIALATAMQESKFKNLANSSMPESLDLPNEGVGKDHDSVGLFQQRPSAGWGSVSECMDPEYSAGKFYEGLKGVKGWENMELTEAAQAVQRSAYPDAYAQWEGLANQILDKHK